jgi:hypothetical protein
MDLVSLLITILVVGLVVWLLIYLIDLIPLPAPFAQVARIIVIAVAVIWLIRVLLRSTGVELTL